MFFKKIAFVFLAAAFFACGTNNEQQEAEKTQSRADVARQEVEQLHDSIMVRMGEIHRLHKQLLHSRDSLGVDSSRVAVYARSLDEAEEAMMRWMREYRKPEGASEEELLRFFEQEKEKIKSVGLQMEEAIEQSKAFLDSLKQTKPE
ncbi:MAG: hypothetical protein KatS3mg033_0171 [Thermonema sp.]|uniref:hypothetical protein n=1 Tax=Thermonema sp. TaxID=2231181 RepID=UPI0021DC9E10|nr:hypothetical protein [Thermonema sp.]GIV38371.1 MAG: hypothetical protein KatS3mg033_0171 [Thermonema sp.]